jgi:hypothetical protein
VGLCGAETVLLLGVEDGRQLSNGVLSAHGKERGVRAAPSSKEQRLKVSSWPTRAQQVVE